MREEKCCASCDLFRYVKLHIFILYLFSVYEYSLYCIDTGADRQFAAEF